MTPGVATLGRPPRDLVVWRPGAPVVLWKPGLPVELVWFCSPGEPLVGAVPEEGTVCFLTNLSHLHFFYQFIIHGGMGFGMSGVP